jgi:hypothetical protein
VPVSDTFFYSVHDVIQSMMWLNIDVSLEMVTWPFPGKNCSPFGDGKKSYPVEPLRAGQRPRGRESGMKNERRWTNAEKVEHPEMMMANII